MASWSDVTVAAPDLAQRVGRTFAVRRHVTLATLRKDGAPRISGTEVEFADDGEVYVAMMPLSLKALDLRRDPRFALHSPTEDPPEDDPAAWLGESKISGRAVEVSAAADGPHRFRLELEAVVLTTVGGDHLVLDSWHEGRGVERRERR